MTGMLLTVTQTRGTAPQACETMRTSKMHPKRFTPNSAVTRMHRDYNPWQPRSPLTRSRDKQQR